MQTGGLFQISGINGLDLPVRTRPELYLMILKLCKNEYQDVSENNFLGVGGMLMYDRAMSGIVKSTYASLDLSYNITLAEDDNSNKHRLGIGFGATYGRRYVDFSKLDFEDQFTGSGFNTGLPTGEAFLSNMKPFVSASTGLVYSYSNEKSNLDMGIAAFHVNKPKQTFLEDQNQYLAMRSVAHINFETFINDRVVFNSNGIYQTQAKASYLSIGAALGYYLDESEETMITGGLWYSSKNAIIPYAGIAYKDFQFGLTYDATISKLATSVPHLSTFELSIIFRGTKNQAATFPARGSSFLSIFQFYKLPLKSRCFDTCFQGRREKRHYLSSGPIKKKAPF